MTLTNSDNYYSPTPCAAICAAWAAEFGGGE
jgi:hypothetical protein